MLKIFTSISTFVSFCLLIILLNISTPLNAGPFGVLAVFILAYLLSLGVMTYFLYGISRVIAHLSSVFIVSRPFEKLTFKNSYYYSTIIAAAPIMLIGLQSVSAVGFYEFFLVFIFLVIGCLYISKRIR